MTKRTFEGDNLSAVSGAAYPLARSRLRVPADWQSQWAWPFSIEAHIAGNTSPDSRVDSLYQLYFNAALARNIVLNEYRYIGTKA